MQPSAAAPQSMEQKSCHNCRRRRLRCDRSVPACHKCTRAGQRCLGYGRLYRWVHSDSTIGPRGRSASASASTGAGVTLTADSSVLLRPRSYSGEQLGITAAFNSLGHGAQVLAVPVDPLLQDLSTSSRHYLFYFASRLCQDLVVHDNPELGTNPFRDLIPMSQAYPSLQHIIIGVSAVHYYHAIENSTPDIAGRSQLAQRALVDALRARQDATRALITFIDQKPAGHYAVESEQDRAALLATILFFINFALIDSGKEGWKTHLVAAGRLLFAHSPAAASLLLRAGDGEVPEYHHSPSAMDLSLLSSPTTTQELSKAPNQPLTACDYVTSDTVAYSIWCCALESLVLPSSPSPTHSADCTPQSLTWDAAEVSRILSRTEDNSYHSCPARLMGVLLQTARITQHIKTSGYRSPNTAHMGIYLSLLKEAETFDINGWAAGVSRHLIGMLGVVMNEQEVSLRRHTAATYRAAVCLYILLVAPGLPAEIRRRAQLSNQDLASLPMTLRTEDLGTTIVEELSFIPKTNPLFKFTVWPVFLTGIDAVSDVHRAWVIERLRAMLDVFPWGIVTSAMETLSKIWKMRDEAVERDADDAGLASKTAEVNQAVEESSCWLTKIHGLRIDCLIV